MSALYAQAILKFGKFVAGAFRLERGDRIEKDIDAGGQRPGADDGQCLRQHLGVDQEHRTFAGDPPGQRHRRVAVALGRDPGVDAAFGEVAVGLVDEHAGMVVGQHDPLLQGEQELAPLAASFWRRADEMSPYVAKVSFRVFSDHSLGMFLTKRLLYSGPDRRVRGM